MTDFNNFDNLITFLCKTEITTEMKEKLRSIHESLNNSETNTSTDKLIFNERFNGIQHIIESLNKIKNFAIMDTDTKDIVFYMYCFTCLLNIMKITNPITIPPLPDKITSYTYTETFLAGDITECIEYVTTNRNMFNDSNLNNTDIKERFRKDLSNKLIAIQSAVNPSPSASASASVPSANDKKEIIQHLYNYFCFVYMCENQYLDRSDYMKYMKSVYQEEYSDEKNNKIIQDLNNNTFEVNPAIPSSPSP